MQLNELQAKNKVERWLRQEQTGSRKIRAAFDYVGVEYAELPTYDLSTIFKVKPYLNFIAHYNTVGANIDALRQSDYYEHLALRFRERPAKRKKIMRLYPDLPPDEAFEARITERFQKFIALYEGMKQHGWRFKHPRKRTANSFKESYLSLMKPPSDPESLKIVFKSFQLDAIAAGERPALKLIDGHHRIACWHALGQATAPCGIYHLRRKQEIEHAS